MTPSTPTPLAIGAHVDQTDPVGEALARGTSIVQMFLGNPQSYKGPVVEYAGGAEALRAAAEEAGVDLVVHAPYIVNVATTNNRDPDPEPQAAPAAHGRRGRDRRQGSGGARRARHNKSDDPAVGFDNWRKAVEATDIKVPLLIENTAGGDHAMARQLDRIARLWDAVGAAEGANEVGFCLDTCHAWAGGIQLGDAVEQIRSITGRIDLVHANDSRDGFDSGADRHANFGAGQLPPDEFVAVVREAGAPVVCETPGGATEHLADIAWLREHL